MAVMGYCEDCKKPYYIDVSNSKVEMGINRRMILVTWCPSCKESSVAVLTEKIEVKPFEGQEAPKEDSKPNQPPV